MRHQSKLEKKSGVISAPSEQVGKKSGVISAPSEQVGKKSGVISAPSEQVGKKKRSNQCAIRASWKNEQQLQNSIETGGDDFDRVVQRYPNEKAGVKFRLWMRKYVRYNNTA